MLDLRLEDICRQLLRHWHILWKMVLISRFKYLVQNQKVLILVLVSNTAICQYWLWFHFSKPTKKDSLVKISDPRMLGFAHAWCTIKGYKYFKNRNQAVFLWITFANTCVNSSCQPNFCGYILLPKYPKHFVWQVLEWILARLLNSIELVMQHFMAIKRSTLPHA